MLFSSYRRLSGWKFCKMWYEASKLWRTGIFSPCCPFSNFNGSLPTVKHFIYSVANLSSLRAVWFFSPSAWKEKKYSVSVFLKFFEGRTQMLKTFESSDINVSAVQSSFQTSKVLSFFSASLETCAFVCYYLSGSTGANEGPFISPTSESCCSLLLRCVAVTAWPLTEMD